MVIVLAIVYENTGYGSNYKYETNTSGAFNITNEIINSKHEFVRFFPPPHCSLACEDPLHALCKTIKDI